MDRARTTHREASHSQNRRFLKKYIPEGGVGVEVGVFWAHFSEVLVRHFKPSKLYLVDPWDRLHGETFVFKSAYTLDGALTTETAMGAALALARKHPDVVEVRKEFSTEFFAQIEDGTLDWIYLDARHKYKDVLEDLESAWPKLKSTGVLFGDDYFLDPNAKHAGTRQAVDAFCQSRGLTLIVEDAFQYVIPGPEAPLPDDTPGKQSAPNA